MRADWEMLETRIRDMSGWDEVFDRYGVKRVSPNDKRKNAFVPGQEQKEALEFAGMLPADGGPAPEVYILVLGDGSRDRVMASYYRSSGHPQRERRIGREFISQWLEEGDEVLIGVRNGQVFAAKVQDPALHEIIREEVERRAVVELHQHDAAVLTAPVDPAILERLREKYADAGPVLKGKLIRHVERGSVGEHVKRACGYRCQICEALGSDGLGFAKRSGGRYVEAHHMMPVAGLTPGSLGPRNVVCLCANHHRQLHYGNVTIGETPTEFV